MDDAELLDADMYVADNELFAVVVGMEYKSLNFVDMYDDDAAEVDGNGWHQQEKQT